jgi:hypothetical protein
MSYCRFLSYSAIQSEPSVDVQCDLITFLAAVQAAQIDILPITWQSAREPVGEGGTSSIKEAPINLQTSFAFKCVKDETKGQQMIKTRIFQAFIREITVLSHPSIRRHPNIINLQGICWDIQSKDEIWPVLIFEKTQFGDLYNFMTLPVGRDLGMIERVKLCADVVSAIADMHENSRLLISLM